MDRGALLSELIRIVRAVDVEPFSRRFVAAGLDPALVPTGLDVPAAPSWLRLIGGILRLGETLPGAAIPDVVELYAGWCVGLLGQDSLTPVLVRWFDHRPWIESARWAERGSGVCLFGGELEDHQIRASAPELRGYFIAFSNRVPDLAVHYLQLLKLRRPDDVAVRACSGGGRTLAQAAPVELAQLTASVLMSSADHGYGTTGVVAGRVRYLDYQFMPASPRRDPSMNCWFTPRNRA